jgi:hypothetical protein
VYFYLRQDSGNPGILWSYDKLNGYRWRQVSELLVSVVRRDPGLSVKLVDNGRHVKKNVTVLYVRVKWRHLRHVQLDVSW